MECTVRIVDESLSGEIKSERSLKLLKSITVEEIIVSRIKSEVGKYNDQEAEPPKMLVRPGLKERLLNRKNPGKKKKIDPEEQIGIALRAFKENGFFILVDGRQYDKLTDRVMLDENSKVSFIKLVPLAGG